MAALQTHPPMRMVTTTRKRKPVGKAVVPISGHLFKVDDSHQRNFRKANESIGLRVSRGNLSLLSRKIFNVMIANAQEQGEPGRAAPMEDEIAREYYWIPMSKIATDVRFDSKDVQAIKDCVQDLQSLRVVVEGEKAWTSEALLSSAKIYNPAGLNKKGGKVWFGYAFPPEVAQLLLNPREYTRLSLYYQALLRSPASLALYEMSRRFATNPSRLTSKEEWEWWFGVLTGRPVDDQLPEYKYFKRDTVLPAMAEVNAVTDLTLELKEHKLGRRVKYLQFEVHQKSQHVLDLPAQPVFSGELITRMVGLGVSQKDASDLVVLYESPVLEANIALLERRMADTKQAPVASPSAFLKAALKNKWASAAEVAKAGLERKAKESMPVAPPAPAVRRTRTAQTVEDLYDQDRMARAELIYEELNDTEKEACHEEFLAQATDTVKRSFKRSGPKAPMVRQNFFFWLANKELGEKSDEEFMRFARSARI